MKKVTFLYFLLIINFCGIISASDSIERSEEVEKDACSCPHDGLVHLCLSKKCRFKKVWVPGAGAVYLTEHKKIKEE